MTAIPFCVFMSLLYYFMLWLLSAPEFWRNTMSSRAHYIFVKWAIMLIKCIFWLKNKKESENSCKSRELNGTISIITFPQESHWKPQFNLPLSNEKNNESLPWRSKDRIYNIILHVKIAPCFKQKECKLNTADYFIVYISLLLFQLWHDYVFCWKINTYTHKEKKINKKVALIFSNATINLMIFKSTHWSW